MKLKQLKNSDFRKDHKYDFLFPIGSTEQHGPFIPFGTDTYITDYLVEQISKAYPELIILPTLEYSRSQEHRGFYGTIWLTEETLAKVMFDICQSLKDQTKNIFITSFHANDSVIKKFIDNNSFGDTKIVYLEVANEEDDKNITDILGGPLDDHAGNSEISNMLVIDKALVKLPTQDYPKSRVDNPWKTDNLIDKCPNGIADNHPQWNVDSSNGKRILDIYVNRMTKNLKNYLPNHKA